jgi:hypothetical protein
MLLAEAGNLLLLVAVMKNATVVQHVLVAARLLGRCLDAASQEQSDTL